VSLVGYATAGAFLGLAYFDYYYTLIALVVLCKLVLTAGTADQVAVPAATPAQPPHVRQPALTPGWSAFKPSRSTHSMREGRG
jgi:hypothetical protein